MFEGLLNILKIQKAEYVILKKKLHSASLEYSITQILVQIDKDINKITNIITNLGEKAYEINI